MLGLRDALRKRCELRARVEAYNQAHGMPGELYELVTYFGQCLLDRGPAEPLHELEHEEDE